MFSLCLSIDEPINSYDYKEFTNIEKSDTYDDIIKEVNNITVFNSSKQKDKIKNKIIELQKYNSPQNRICIFDTKLIEKELTENIILDKFIGMLLLQYIRLESFSKEFLIYNFNGFPLFPYSMMQYRPTHNAESEFDNEYMEHEMSIKNEFNKLFSQNDINQEIIIKILEDNLTINGKKGKIETNSDKYRIKFNILNEKLILKKQYLMYKDIIINQQELNFDFFTRECDVNYLDTDYLFNLHDLEVINDNYYSIPIICKYKIIPEYENYKKIYDIYVKIDEINDDTFNIEIKYSTTYVNIEKRLLNNAEFFSISILNNEKRYKII